MENPYQAASTPSGNKKRDYLRPWKLLSWMAGWGLVAAMWMSIAAIVALATWIVLYLMFEPQFEQFIQSM